MLEKWVCYSTLEILTLIKKYYFYSSHRTNWNLYSLRDQISNQYGKPPENSVVNINSTFSTNFKVIYHHTPKVQKLDLIFITVVQFCIFVNYGENLQRKKLFSSPPLERPKTNFPVKLIQIYVQLTFYKNSLNQFLVEKRLQIKGISLCTSFKKTFKNEKSIQYSLSFGW